MIRFEKADQGFYDVWLVIRSSTSRLAGGTPENAYKLGFIEQEDDGYWYIGSNRPWIKERSFGTLKVAKEYFHREVIKRIKKVL